MKTAVQKIEIKLNEADLARIKHLQSELHIRRKAELVRLALIRLEGTLKGEKDIVCAIKGYTELPETEKENAGVLKASLETIMAEDW